jgi:hypothetical protein
MQVLCHLSHAPGPFRFSYFSYMVSRFLLGLALDHNLLAYTSQVAGLTGIYHCAQLVC